MTYLEHINNLIRETTNGKPVVIFGQNITHGSCLGGLTKGINPGKNGLVINSTNAENSLVGIGFGLMLEGTSAIFFMKQLDFLLLGIDHLVNTYNNIRSTQPIEKLGSFTIFPVTIDNGFQGPQSSLNTFADFCTISRTRGYTLTNRYDASMIIKNHLINPGFRIITVSQRLFKEELLAPHDPIFVSPNETIFQYSHGNTATIATFNFAFPHGNKLEETMRKSNVSVSLFNVNSPSVFDPTPIIKDANRTGKLVVIDDSKSDNLPYNQLLADKRLKTKTIVMRRVLSDDWLYPTEDLLEVDYQAVIKKIKSL